MSDAASHFCIYCFSHVYDRLAPEKRLTDEHLIPAAIGGGDIVAEQSSCRKCQDIIDPFETQMHNWLFPVSRALDVGRKSGKWRKSKQKFRQILADRTVDTFVLLEDLPVNFTFFVLHGEPGLLAGKDLTGKDTRAEPGQFIAQFFHNDFLRRLSVTSGLPAVQTIHPGLLARYIIKIAYVAASVMYGRDTFVSPLCIFILDGNTAELANYFGGRQAERKPDTLHQVKVNLQNGFLVAIVQLFASFLGYEFEVVVGRPDLNYAIWNDVPDEGRPS